MHNIELSYDYWTAGMLDHSLIEVDFVLKLTPQDDILNAILPMELLDGSPSGFSVTGHLGRFSL
jgi:tRNA (guanine37-N1)-methyltransferase